MNIRSYSRNRFRKGCQPDTGNRHHDSGKHETLAWSKKKTVGFLTSTLKSPERTSLRNSVKLWMMLFRFFLVGAKVVWMDLPVCVLLRHSFFTDSSDLCFVISYQIHQPWRYQTAGNADGFFCGEFISIIIKKSNIMQ